MIKVGVWEAVPRNKVPKDAKVISTTWAMKKKSNGTFRARVNAWGSCKLLENIIMWIVFLRLLLMKLPLGWCLFSLLPLGGQTS